LEDSPIPLLQSSCKRNGACPLVSLVSWGIGMQVGASDYVRSLVVAGPSLPVSAATSVHRHTELLDLYGRILAFSKQMEGEGLARLGIVEIESDLGLLAGMEQWEGGVGDVDDQVLVLAQIELQLNALLTGLDRLDPHGHMDLGFLWKIQVLGPDEILRPFVDHLLRKLADLTVGELHLLRAAACDQLVVEDRRPGEERGALSTLSGSKGAGGKPSRLPALPTRQRLESVLHS